jgi:hypothetical protein
MTVSRETRAFVLVVLVAAGIAAVSAQPFAGAWNDGSRLATVESLVDHGTLAIDDSVFVAVPQSADLGPGPPYRGVALERGTLDKLYIDGHFYSDKSPVPALLLAVLYQCLQWLCGLHVRLHPDAFCYWMTLASSGAAYVVAVACIFGLGRHVGLPLRWRLVVAASFALATVSVVYVRHVNNHILLLGVSAALMLDLAGLAAAPSWPRMLLAGSLAGLGYTSDLGAGPPLLVCAGLLVAWRTGKQRQAPVAATARSMFRTQGACPRFSAAACFWFALGALPWLALHHAVNYAVGGTLGPANAVPEYFNWEGCPFHGSAMTGAWHHHDVFDFGVYALALLFGKRGFVGHNLPLFLLLPGFLWLCRWPRRQWPELLFAAAWCGGTWLAYAATSHNYSGANCSVRWFVPLLAPAYYALIVMLERWPAFRADFLLLSGWGLVLMAVAWCYGPWIPHMVPGFWPIQGAALASWAVLAWRRRLKQRARSRGYTSKAALVLAESH